MRKVLIMTLVLVGAGLTPLATAEHMSIGSRDSVGVQATETGFADQTVPDDRADDGRTDPANCNPGYNNDGTAVNSQENASEAADKTGDSLASDAFCGMMHYNTDTNYTRLGPRDQVDNSDKIDTFDVVRGSYVGGVGLTLSHWPLPIGGVINALHDAGSPELFPANHEDGASFEQQFSPNLVYPEAGRLLQQTSGGAWEMNGFDSGGPQKNFVAFLRGPGGSAGASGDLINAKDLQSIVDGDGGLPNDAKAAICGFSVDQGISSQTPDACQISFTWVSEGEDGAEDGRDFKPNQWGEACDSPTYVCGANQPAWYAQLVAVGYESANDYDVHHFVAAPTISDCTGAVDPGFVTPEETDADKAFLAHDLDVSSPLATGIGNTGTSNTESYARNSNLETQGYVFDTINERVDDTLETARDESGLDPSVTTPDLGQTPDQAFSKEDKVEPNYHDPSLEDSQTFQVDRDTDSTFCEEVRGTNEEFVDPWKNIVDNEVIFDFLGEPTGWTPPFDGAYDGGDDLYLNFDESQDASNRPGYGQYFTHGNIGMFADVNDNGAYQPASFGQKLNNIGESGAYPMIWDVRLDGEVLRQKVSDPDVSDEQAELAAMEGAGCTPTFSDTNWDWTEEAKKADYGPRTGLIQAVYLAEPTYLYHFYESTASPSPGQQVHVSMSDGLIELHQWGSEDQKAFVEHKVNQALQRMPDGAPQSLDDPNVQLQYKLTHPADNPARDVEEFSGQCDAGTGGYSGLWSFGHYCGAPDSPACSGSTIVTEYLYENRADDGVLGGNASEIPALNIDGALNNVDENDDVIFPQKSGRDATSVVTWFDVDPLDGNPDRNNDNCDRPQHHGEDAENQGCQGHRHSPDAQDRYVVGP